MELTPPEPAQIEAAEEDVLDAEYDEEESDE
jgi:hypothetical protein